MPGQDTFVALRRRALLDEQRPRLLGLAYRLLGTLTDAHLVLDEVARSSSSADLTALVTRLALRRLEEVRPRRAGYAGRWLPEPVAETSLSLPTLLAMERLSPLERCAYVLRVADGLPYADVAAGLGRSGPASRQLVRRARNRLGVGPSALTVDEAVVQRFAAACRSARLTPLAEVLADEVAVHTDAPHPRADGRDQAAALLLSTLRRLPRGTVLVEERVNGEPGLVGRAGGRPVCALAVQSDAGRVAVVLVVTNPARLGGLITTATQGASGHRLP
ncbi:MAG TPA: sigma factor-like helix-turn-helix DNA-binding protein [Lapillicoccus sp.]|nr:sigma factor-like helix-turn-helix DNA-binding protein [Lapillicoccus sp.]